MPTLRNCLARAAKNISVEDKASIQERVRDFGGNEIRAAQDYLEQLQFEREDLVNEIRSVAGLDPYEEAAVAAPEPEVLGTGYTAEQARAMVPPNLNVPVSVISSAQLPPQLANRPGVEVPGYWDGEKVVLVHDVLRDDADAEVQIAHELWHAGAENVIEDWDALIEDYNGMKQRGGKSFESVYSEMLERYADPETGDVGDPGLEIREFLAVAAEHEIKSGPVGRFLTRVKSLIQQGLRALGFRREFNMIDVSDILRDARSSLELPRAQAVDEWREPLESQRKVKTADAQELIDRATEPGSPIAGVQRPKNSEPVDVLRRHLNRDRDVGAQGNQTITVELDGREESLLGARPTAEQWIARVERLLSPQEIAQAREWYREIVGVFTETFGENGEKMALGWLMSNQRVDPAGAMHNMLRVLEQVRSGATGLQGGLNHTLVQALFEADSPQEMVVGEKGIGRKLHDFVDSALSKLTRTWMGNAPEGGSPVVVDIWTARDMGYIDQPQLNRLIERYGEEMFVGVKLDFGLSPSETQYEHAAQDVRDLTGELNEAGWNNGNLSPLEVQAIGWTAMAKEGGSAAFNAEQSIERNTRQISYGLDFGKGAPLADVFPSLTDLPYEQKMAATQTVMNRVVEIARDIVKPAELHSFYGPGKYEQWAKTKPSGQTKVISSQEAAEDLADIIGYLAQQTEVFVVRPLKSGSKLAVDILGIPHDRALEFWDRLTELLPPAMTGDKSAFGVIEVDGVHGIRTIRPQGGKTETARVISPTEENPDATSPMWEAVQQVEQEMGLDIQYDMLRVQNRVRGNDWTKDKDGNGYLKRLHQRYGPEIQRRLLDYRTEIEALIGKTLSGETDVFTEIEAAVDARTKIQLSQRPATGPPRRGAPRFSNKETEDRWREARKGLADQRPLSEKSWDVLKHLGAGFTRRHIHLPNKPEFALVNEALRQYEAAPEAAKEEAVRQLRKILTGLDKTQFDIFSRKVVLDDLAYEDEVGHVLPFGLTPETLTTDKALIDRLVANDPAIAEALARHTAMQDELKERLVSAGILDAESAANPAYYRHQVLTYARERQLAAGTGDIRTPKPGYAKQRKGSLEDINANYLEAEFEYVHRALIDLKAVETINKIKKDYDIHRALVDAAKRKSEATGEKYTWEDMIPEGYEKFQPDKGNVFYVGKTLPERAFDDLLEKFASGELSDPAVPADALKEVAAMLKDAVIMGGKKYEMVIPSEVAETMRDMVSLKDEGLPRLLLRVPQTKWKQWTLISPRRVLKYNLNNLSGDLDAIIAGSPKAVRRLPEAIRELWQVMHGAEPSARYKEAVERGVFDSGLTIQEIPDINILDPFENIIDQPTLAQPLKFSASKLYKVWSVLRDYTRFRENWLRYAAYLDYADRLESGESIESIGYGASRSKMVDEILAAGQVKDAAALLAREMVGDYGNVSAFGQGIRAYTYPFYSWLEVNTRRYNRLLINAWQQGAGKGLKQAGLIGLVGGSRLSAWLVIRGAFVYGAIQAWNHLMFPDEEEELSASSRVRLHVNLGRDENGEIRTLRFQGALSDYLQWIGLEDVVAAFSEIESGRAGWVDVLKAVAKGAPNKIAGGITPVLKQPLEQVTGEQFWPDAFNPTPIRDRPRHLARLFALENEYDWLTGNPSRGYGKSLTQSLVYKADAGEQAYNKIRGLASDWNRKEKGISGGSTYSTPRSRVLYKYKLAKKFGDEEAEKKALAEMGKMGMQYKDVAASVRAAHPLGPVSMADRPRFIATLTPGERESLRQGATWYAQMYQP